MKKMWVVSKGEIYNVDNNARQFFDLKSGSTRGRRSNQIKILDSSKEWKASII